MGYTYLVHVHNVSVCICTMQALLSNPSIRQEVCCSHHSTDGVMQDFCDANFVKTHPVFKTYPDALQFILFYDDIELANPLRAKVGIHKLGSYIIAIVTCIWQVQLVLIFIMFCVTSAQFFDLIFRTSS